MRPRVVAAACGVFSLVVTLSACTKNSGQGDKTDVNRTTTDASEYPITLVSYLIACQSYQDSAKGALVKAYAQYVTSDAGQQAAASTAKSAPMTGTLATKAQAAAATIK